MPGQASQKMPKMPGQASHHPKMPGKMPGEDARTEMPGQDARTGIASSEDARTGIASSGRWGSAEMPGHGREARRDARKDARKMPGQASHHPGVGAWPGGHMPVLPGSRSLVKMGILPPVCPPGGSSRSRHATELGGRRSRRVQYRTIGKQRRCLVGGKCGDLTGGPMPAAIQDRVTGPRIRRG